MLPKSQKAIETLSQSFFSLLASDNNPQATVLRSAFVPALLASDRRPTTPQEAQLFDEQLRGAFASPPSVVVAQGIISAEQIAQASAKGTLGDCIFVPFALHQELEGAKEGGEREAEANLNSEPV